MSYTKGTLWNHISQGNANYANANRGTNTTLKNTGETGDQKCKIFDMAANLSEWTTEYSISAGSSYANSCTDRGVLYSNSSSYTSNRNYSGATYSNKNILLFNLNYSKI